MQILPSKNPMTSSKASYIENTKLLYAMPSKYLDDYNICGFLKDFATFLNLNIKSNLNLLEATIFPYFIVVTKHVIYIDININQTQCKK